MMESNIQYFHGTKQKYNNKQYTVAVTVPNRDLIKLMIFNLLGTNITEVSIPVGITKVNKKDQYNKKIGRELSFSRLEEKQFKLVEVVVTVQGIVIEFHNEEIDLFFLLLPDNEKVRLINTYI